MAMEAKKDGFGRRRKEETARQVQQRATEAIERYSTLNERQKKTIDSMMAYLEQTDQVAAYIRWRDSKTVDA